MNLKFNTIFLSCFILLIYALSTYSIRTDPLYNWFMFFLVLVPAILWIVQILKINTLINFMFAYVFLLACLSAEITLHKVHLINSRVAVFIFIGIMTCNIFIVNKFWKQK